MIYPHHGGNLRAFAQRHGCEESEILDFSSNVNPWGPPASAVEAYHRAASEIAHYPDPSCYRLKHEIAGGLGLFPENVAAGNGSTELIYLIVQCLKPKRALLVEPCFSEYRRALSAHGCEIRSVFSKEENGFLAGIPELLNAARGTDLVIFANPGNPAGTAYGTDEIKTLLDEMKRREIFVVLDEAFADWKPEISAAPCVAEDRPFFLLRSFTKFFGIPGIRAGYGLGPKRLIERLESLQVTWSVDGAAEAVAIACLRDKPFQEFSRRAMSEERKLFSEELKMEDLKIYPSEANFFLVRSAGLPADRIAEALARDKIMIRNAALYPGLDGHYFRLAVRTRDENVRLTAALRRVFEKTHA